VDGHVETIPFPPDPFVCVKTIHPQRHIPLVRRLLARLRSSQSLRIPIAVYELTEQGGRTFYRYIASQAVCERDLRSREALQAVRQRACNLEG
jgi:hypothetical protein